MGGTTALNWRAWIMEFLGVTALVYIGGWSCIMMANGHGSTLSVAFAHMFVLAVMIWVGAATSGAHYNPAVTLGLMITCHHGWIESLFYILFQFAGSFFGALLLMGLVPVQYKDRTENDNLYGFPEPYEGMEVEALIFEMLGTFILTFMVFALAVDKRAPKHIYGIGIGGALGVSILAFGAVSGAALNPARWLGPATLVWDWNKQFKNVWIYTVGPFTGACAAAALYNWVLYKKEEEKVVVKDVSFD